MNDTNNFFTSASNNSTFLQKVNLISYSNQQATISTFDLLKGTQGPLSTTLAIPQNKPDDPLYSIHLLFVSKNNSSEKIPFEKFSDFDFTCSPVPCPNFYQSNPALFFTQSALYRLGTDLKQRNMNLQLFYGYDMKPLQIDDFNETLVKMTFQSSFENVFQDDKGQFTKNTFTNFWPRPLIQTYKNQSHFVPSNIEYPFNELQVVETLFEPNNDPQRYQNADYLSNINISNISERFLFDRKGLASDIFINDQILNFIQTNNVKTDLDVFYIYKNQYINLNFVPGFKVSYLGTPIPNVQLRRIKSKDVDAFQDLVVLVDYQGHILKDDLWYNGYSYFTGNPVLNTSLPVYPNVLISGGAKQIFDNIMKRK